ncbi:hypothetical protein NHX12_007927 [Muraenolepis orangiensis]|uniref:Uncharacterized protein n=1 Tax=Muraenolepis orangiensis TaxID=630683 RepID=A0A9Q0DMY0_9TELE|nr:hypothetical protein NHX12_007927 [Muraenolepis orangiensis]
MLPPCRWCTYHPTGGAHAATLQVVHIPPYRWCTCCHPAGGAHAATLQVVHIPPYRWCTYHPTGGAHAATLQVVHMLPPCRWCTYHPTGGAHAATLQVVHMPGGAHTTLQVVHMPPYRWCTYHPAGGAHAATLQVVHIPPYRWCTCHPTVPVKSFPREHRKMEDVAWLGFRQAASTSQVDYGVGRKRLLCRRARSRRHCRREKENAYISPRIISLYFGVLFFFQGVARHGSYRIDGRRCETGALVLRLIRPLSSGGKTKAPKHTALGCSELLRRCVYSAVMSFAVGISSAKCTTFRQS